MKKIDPPPSPAPSQPQTTDPRTLWTWITAQERAPLRRDRASGMVMVEVVPPDLRARRTKRLRRFRSRPRRKQAWICCAWLAEWCARPPGSIERDGKLFDTACRRIMLSLFDGQFDGRFPPLLLTNAGASGMSQDRLHALAAWWLTQRSGDAALGWEDDWLRRQLDWTIAPGDGWDIHISTELRWFVNHTWVLRDAAMRWLDDCGMPSPPWLMQAPVRTEPQPDAKATKAASGADRGRLGPQADTEATETPAKQTWPADSLSSQMPSATKRHGLDFRALDAALVSQMHDMIQHGQARNPMDAARAIVRQASGHGTAESKVKRLLSGYAERFRSVDAESAALSPDRVTFSPTQG